MLRSVRISFLILFFSSNLAFGFQGQFGLSPDNSKDLLISTILSARKQLLINIYQFDNADIANAVVDRIRAGVQVELLLEGQPVGSISPEGKKVRSAIRAAMDQSGQRNNHFYVMDGRNGKKRRYAFDHAKYVVIDSKKALISSENFTSTGHAAAGKVGNRGWEAVLDNAGLASELTRIFREDADTFAGDVIEWSNQNEFLANGFPQAAKTRSVPAIAQSRGDVRSATLVTSPDSVEGITNLIRSARSSLELQFMSLPSIWKSPKAHQSAIVDELIAAARRGVEVRVLLNDESVFERGGNSNNKGGDETPPGGLAPSLAVKTHANEVTARLLQDLSTCEHLNINARIVDVREVEIEYIHNKGIIVDNGFAFISSINGTQNSVMNNRETGVILESRDAAQYFGQAFDFDWSHSPALKGQGAQDCRGLRGSYWPDFFQN